MIYLFDDKVNRQLDYGWTRDRLDRFSDIIKPINLYSQIEDESIRKEIFSSGNIIIFHESFFDNIENKHGNANNIRNRLNEAQENKDFRVIYFSGSKSSRKFDENIGHIPVSLMYQNLDVFLKHVELGKQDLRYLFFGENYQLEELLENELAFANKNIEDSVQNEYPDCNNFIALTLKNEIETIFENATYETFFLDQEHNFDITDEYLSKKIKEWFTIEEYDNIFIPLCFGPVLSDLNGLRFALQIRCTETPNQFTNIFLYSFIDFSQIVESKYFDILKTKNINLIPYSKLAFEKTITSNFTPLKPEELSREIKKVKLDPPKNYEDSHSIANEWAIYRWASAIKANDEAIEKITHKVQDQLYFKYLKTIYPVKEINPVPKSDLKIKYSGSPKILYIDDEADKGWYEIFCKILCDENDLEFHYLDGELNSLSREEIIKKSLDTIKVENIDIVLLDFRLHANDFNNTEVTEFTGLQLLKKIKKLNPGIQVIIFSATNKVWNLQALQKAGADGFVVKESPENSLNPEFTNQAINSFIAEIQRSSQRIFLKTSFISLAQIKKNLSSLEYIDDTDYHHFIQGLLKQLDVIAESVKNIEMKSKSTLDIVFLNCYNFLEQYKNNYYLKFIDNHYVLGIDEVEMYRYSSSKKEVTNHGIFIPNNSNDQPSWFSTLSAIVIDYFEVCDYNDPLIKRLNSIKNKRNRFIHNTKPHFDRNEVQMIIDIMSIISQHMKE